jgi:PPP family 3-phenylpropionic acid transporter
MSIFRWILFPINFGFIGYFVLQCLHSCTYACVHTGIQRRILASVQETQEASAQGLYFFYNGMCLGIMTFIAGYLYAWFGLGSYYVMSGVAVFGLAMVIVAYYLQPQSSLAGGKTSEAS